MFRSQLGWTPLHAAVNFSSAAVTSGVGLADGAAVKARDEVCVRGKTHSVFQLACISRIRSDLVINPGRPQADNWSWCGGCSITRPTLVHWIRFGATRPSGHNPSV